MILLASALQGSNQNFQSRIDQSVDTFSPEHLGCSQKSCATECAPGPINASDAHKLLGGKACGSDDGSAKRNVEVPMLHEERLIKRPKKSSHLFENNVSSSTSSSADCLVEVFSGAGDQPAQHPKQRRVSLRLHDYLKRFVSTSG
jgi:hypothetical protein